MNKIKLDESNDEFKDIKEGWKKQLGEVNLDTLPDFLKMLTEDYQHDYGTICHAIAFSAIAAANAVNRSDQGGITGFQAGAVMWEFIREWNYSHNKTGLKLVDYDNFLYPQYESEFQKTISQDTWVAIHKAAQERIEEADQKHEKYLVDLEQYKKDIAEYIEKYPDYHDRKEHYDHLDCGTGDEWEAYKKKKTDGFEFAPRKPFELVDPQNPVYLHWQSIVSGRIPFGYVISNDQ